MATLTVGSGSGFEYSTLANAIAASQDGDLIQVQAGTYTNDFAAINTSITIEGVGGLVNLVATSAQQLQDLKGILIIGQDGTTGPNVTLDNISFSGAAIPNAAGGNGAGIRYQSGNLTLNNCYFFDNQEGLLADASNGTITINNTEFADNGNANPPPGIEHNLYVGAIQQLTIDNSYFTGAIVGHDIKSRAANTTIENSRIVEPTGNASYEIDLPNGGNALIENNVIEKGPGAGNSHFISFAEEGNAYGSAALTVTGNTVLNDYGGGANLVVNDGSAGATITDNTLYGLTTGQIAEGPVTSTAGNTVLPQAGEPALNTAPPYLPVIPFSFGCFVAGTRILTDTGKIPVEALRIGQSVVVVRQDGNRALRPIRWIGHRTIDVTRHADPTLVCPIRIRAHAFAPNAPQRDLLVSPDHAIFAGGLLIPARLLRNGATIRRDDALRTVRYFHVELDQHAILLAEGLPAETYLDTGNRNVFENSGTPMLLHPDLSGGAEQAQREAASCAPFAADPARVRPVWQQLAARAEGLGCKLPEPVTTTDPALRLLADERTCRPVAMTADRAVFVLPPASRSVRLLSRATAPCDIRPWVEDRRRLGVAVGHIVASGPAGRSELPADHPALIDGWWAAERDGAKLWRWSNGNAALPVPPHTTLIELHLSGANTYLHSHEKIAGRSSCLRPPVMVSAA